MGMVKNPSFIVVAWIFFCVNRSTGYAAKSKASRQLCGSRTLQ